MCPEPRRRRREPDPRQRAGGELHRHAPDPAHVQRTGARVRRRRPGRADRREPRRERDPLHAGRNADLGPCDRRCGERADRGGGRGPRYPRGAAGTRSSSRSDRGTKSSRTTRASGSASAWSPASPSCTVVGAWVEEREGGGASFRVYLPFDGTDESFEDLAPSGPLVPRRRTLPDRIDALSVRTTDRSSCRTRERVRFRRR